MSSKRLKNPDAKRVWFITDTHLGVRNNSNEWLDQTRDYFFNWFFPLVENCFTIFFKEQSYEKNEYFLNFHLNYILCFM